MLKIRERLVELMSEHFGEAIAETAKDGGEVFVDHGRGWADGSLDSLDKVEFVMAVEDEFKVDIPDYQIAGFKTLNDIATFVDALTRGPEHGAH